MDSSLRRLCEHDKDGSGRMHTRELKGCLLSLGVLFDCAESIAVLRQYDADSSGSIDLREFASLVRDLEAIKQAYEPPKGWAEWLLPNVPIVLQCIAATWSRFPRVGAAGRAVDSQRCHVPRKSLLHGADAVVVFTGQNRNLPSARHGSDHLRRLDLVDA